jgi:hypothetical protein
MVLPSSGAIDLNSIQTEFGGTNPIGIDEYYRNGTYVPNSTSNNGSIAIDGSTDFYFHPPISFSDFYNASSEYIIIISATTTNVNLQTLFNATYPNSWASNFRKRLVIGAGVTVGSTDPLSYALNIPSGFGSTVRIDNSGSIQGARGAANSGTGGNAIFAGASGISINNQGTIYAGGGGGGQGGTGGGGRRFVRPLFFSTGGGAGGAGGVGQGYNQSNTDGAGGAAGGTGAGTGGTGGTGGTWGTTGADGSVGTDGNSTTAPLLGTAGGPGYGGLGGYYIVGNSNVTWIATGATGTRLGAVG